MFLDLLRAFPQASKRSGNSLRARESNSTIDIEPQVTGPWALSPLFIFGLARYANSLHGNTGSGGAKLAAMSGRWS